MNEVRRYSVQLDEYYGPETEVVRASDYDALLADAKRYQWLRDGGHQLINFEFIIEKCGGEDGLDRTIDRAISTGGKQP